MSYRENISLRFSKLHEQYGRGQNYPEEKSQNYLKYSIWKISLDIKNISVHLGVFNCHF